MKVSTVQHRSLPTRDATGGHDTNLKAGLRATGLEDFRFHCGDLANSGLAALRAFRRHNTVYRCETVTQNT
jgi:hypothetical protein